MKILIISYFFPPYNNIGAIRVGKLAEHWVNAGHDVRIVTAADQPTPPDLATTLGPERITYTRWINVNWLPEQVLGGRERVSRQGFSTRKSFLGKLGWLYKLLFNFPDGQIGWWPYGYAAAAALLRDGWKPDLIYASAKPIAPLLIAKRLAEKHDVPWVAEFRDLWADYHNYGFPEFRQRLEQAMERRVLAKASALVTVSESLAGKLRAKYQLPVAVVMNGFDPADYDRAEAAAGYPADTLNIVYTGMLYSGRQDLSPLFAAVAAMASREKVRMYFFGRYLDEVNLLAAQFNLAHLVSVSAAIPHREAVSKQKQADLLLLALWNDPVQGGILTGKLFEYIGARHPILAVGANRDAAAELIQRRNAGMVSNDPAEIAGFLERMIAKKQGGGGFLLPEEVRAGLTREEQFDKLDAFLRQHELLESPPAQAAENTP